MVKSKAGRPTKGDESKSRQSIIERTLDAIRTKPAIDIQRKDLASASNVNPALISYYFPDKWQLIHLACYPVVMGHADDLDRIASAIDPDLNDLRALIKLYVEFNMANASVLEFYMSSIKHARREDEFLRFVATYRGVLTFLQKLMTSGQLRTSNPVMLQSSLWGLSKYITEN